jgi:phosphoenolpyruvate carboxykinase (ATP)
MSGEINNVPMRKDEVFGFEVPLELPGIDPVLLDPKSTWPDHKAFDEQANKLANMYAKNFKKYEGKSSVDYAKFGPKI